MFSRQLVRAVSIAVIALVSFQDTGTAATPNEWVCEFDCDDGWDGILERCAVELCEDYVDGWCEFWEPGFETQNLYAWCVENCLPEWGCVIDSCDPPSQESGPKAFCFAVDKPV
jgi:hypothetical protein